MVQDQTRLHFRQAGEADLREVYDLYMDATANPYLTYDPMPLADFTTIFTELLASATLFVAEYEGALAGSYRLIRKTHRQSQTIYIGGFVVKSSFKGRGFGTLMLNHIVGETRSRGIKRLELTVDLENHPAIRLYEKLGFETEGVIKKSYRLASTGAYFDEYQMALIL